MFALRIIERVRVKENDEFQQSESNHWLGKGYSKLNPETKEFDNEIDRLSDVLKENWPDLVVEKEVKAIICGENGDSWFVMKDTSLEQHDYFIMTENGKTFERL